MRRCLLVVALVAGASGLSLRSDSDTGIDLPWLQHILPNKSPENVQLWLGMLQAQAVDTVGDLRDASQETWDKLALPGIVVDELKKVLNSNYGPSAPSGLFPVAIRGNQAQELAQDDIDYVDSNGQGSQKQGGFGGDEAGGDSLLDKKGEFTPGGNGDSFLPSSPLGRLTQDFHTGPEDAEAFKTGPVDGSGAEFTLGQSQVAEFDGRGSGSTANTYGGVASGDALIEGGAVSPIMGALPPEQEPYNAALQPALPEDLPQTPDDTSLLAKGPPAEMQMVDQEEGHQQHFRTNPNEFQPPRHHHHHHHHDGDAEGEGGEGEQESLVEQGAHHHHHHDETSLQPEQVAI